MSRDETGFTVIEMAVTLLIIGIVFAAILGFLDQTQRLTVKVAKDVDTEQAAGLALRQMTEDLRGATAISPCDLTSYPSTDYRSCVTFQLPRAASTTATCPGSLVTYTLSASTVRETRLDYPFSCGTPTTRVSGAPVIASVTNGASAPLFSYYDKTGNPIDAVNNPSAVPAAASVKVSLLLNYAPGAPPLSLTSLAAFRNNR
jgi:prepilin-type N-terminal cleavage/methylation domain-containing protein